MELFFFFFFFLNVSMEHEIANIISDNMVLIGEIHCDID